ncbi:MAG: hypothetical protein OEY56_10005 [Cyclobacteriaceae bacterium]|nr:hypothetical protein [Cyclobacteriaceae bacterium]
MRHFPTFFSAAILLTVMACSPSPKQETTEETVSSPGITLTKAPASPAYDDATLTLESSAIELGDAVYTSDFTFRVENYELGSQTPGADTRGIANSDKGQHIHFILNNGPYSAHYEPGVSKQLEKGNYVALAFLSRSYHESVKNPNAYWVDVVSVGDPEEKLEMDFKAPHLFYSRPKGSYSGADTQKLMLDFYLLNVQLSPEGNKVKATINGQEFLIDEWAPYYIEGLPKGEAMVKLELIDAEGNAIPGPFNTVERTVKLEE